MHKWLVGSSGLADPASLQEDVARAAPNQSAERMIGGAIRRGADQQALPVAGLALL
jgi:hypothetical protein